MRVVFTIEEIGAAKQCSSKDKGGMIKELLELMSRIEDNDLAVVIANTINKLDMANQEEFAELLTYPANDFDEEEEE